MSPVDPPAADLRFSGPPLAPPPARLLHTWRLATRRRRRALQRWWYLRGRADAITDTARVPRTPRVLWLSGVGRDSMRYRCQHAAEYAAAAGITGDVIDLTQERSRATQHVDITQYSHLVLHRVHPNPWIYAAMRRMRRQGGSVICDVDDLVFSEAYTDFYTRVGLNRGRIQSDVQLSRSLLMDCDQVTCATPELQVAATGMGHADARVLRNGYSAAMRAHADAALTAHPRTTAARPIILGYASGSPTHYFDFRQISDALGTVLRDHPDTELHIIGPLTLDPALRAYDSQIRFYDPVPWSELPARLRQFDVSLAPIAADCPFSQAKSELKYLEASLVAVPTVASPLPTYTEAIEHQRTGYLASTTTEWREVLSHLIGNRDVRERVGRAARADVLARYGADARVREVHDLFRVPAAGLAAAHVSATPPAQAGLYARSQG